MKQTFVDRHVVVTGAGSGIGQATALEVAARGARVSVVDIDGAAAKATMAAIGARGGSARAYVVDVASASEVETFADAVVSDSGPVDVLVNNAGVAVVAPFHRTAVEDWNWVLGVNFWGTLRVTRAFLPSMVERRSGHVVIVASLGGLIGAPGMVAYSTTKFAVVGFAESLRLELADQGVDVTAVCPGYVRTNLHRATRYGNDAFKRFLDEAPGWYGLTKEKVARELADAVVARRGLVVLGPEKVGWWLKRLTPDIAFAVTRWIARRTVCPEDVSSRTGD